jgi:flagellar protein FlbT
VLEDQHYQVLKALRSLLPREERLLAAAGRA